MTSLMEEPTVATGRAWGGQSMVAPLRRVLVRKPAPPAVEDEFARFGYPRAVDHERTQSEHEAFRALLAESGAEVVIAGPDEAGLLDAIFAYDPSLMTDAGAVLLRPGKELRLAEVDLAERTYAELGIPVIGRIEAPGTVEGGDTLWLDERTLAVGRGYRTNERGDSPAGRAARAVRHRDHDGRSAALARSGRVPAPDVLHQSGRRAAGGRLSAADVGPVRPGAATPRVVVHRGAGRGVRDARLQRAGPGADAGAGLRRQPRHAGPVGAAGCEVVAYVGR